MNDVHPGSARVGLIEGGFKNQLLRPDCARNGADASQMQKTESVSAVVAVRTFNSMQAFPHVR